MALGFRVEGRPLMATHPHTAASVTPSGGPRVAVARAGPRDLAVQAGVDLADG